MVKKKYAFEAFECHKICMSSKYSFKMIKKSKDDVVDEQVQKMSCRAAVRLLAWPKNIKVENLTFFMTLWNILGWSVSILVGLFYLENLSRKQNHMGTEFLWLRDKCLTSESWQELMAINCFNVTSIQLHQNSNKDFGFFMQDLFSFHDMKYCWTLAK